MKSIAAWDYLHFFWDLASGARTRSELSAAERRQADCREVFQSGRLEILDLGNGALRPQSYILSNQGHSVTGVDFVNTFRWNFQSFAYVFARLLFRLHLPATSTKRGDLKLITADVSDLPFKDNSFDLITSVAAFEHFLEVEKVVSECERVLRPGGMVWIAIHPFTALSGGHNVGRRLEKIDELPGGIEPWDHLRKRRLPFTVPLNELSPSQYLSIFEQHLEIVLAESISTEGEELLTSTIRQELSEYSEEELLCSCYLLCARKIS